MSAIRRSSWSTDSNNLYGYDPVSYVFDDEAIQERYTAFRHRYEIQSFSFFAIGILGWCSVSLVAQWRGLNGSMGGFWAFQHWMIVLGVSLWHVVAVIEYRRGWVEKPLRLLFPTADVRAMVRVWRVRFACAHTFVHILTQLAVIGRNLKQCSSEEVMNTYDIIYCSSSTMYVPLSIASLCHDHGTLIVVSSLLISTSRYTSSPASPCPGKSRTTASSP